MLNTESRHNSGLDQGPSRDPWLTMDYYLGADSLSLQEMLDVDIKCEVESIIGVHPELGLNFTDLSPLEMADDPVCCQGDLNSWFGTCLFNGNSNSSNSYNLDLNGIDAASIMVNPNSVMPYTSTKTTNPENDTLTTTMTVATPITSPATTTTAKTTVKPIKRKYPATHKNNAKKLKMEIDQQIANIKYENDITETEDEEEEDGEEEEDHDQEEEDEDEEEEEDEIEEEDEGEESEAETPKKINVNGAVRINVKPQVLTMNVSTIKTLPPQNPTKSRTAERVISYSKMKAGNLKIVPGPTKQTLHIRRQTNNNNIHVTTSTVTSSSTAVKKEKECDTPACEAKLYPKPGYSYSCLIAMALKNSQRGCLPVSEIYNFMCQHFPYFKTAPSGWKNSVRHNLSLNKCFEKIEKPAGNGNQRKGCLWAINPSKVTKMDEEVQKWSRKDPVAIKNAMIYPDQLKLLERGEMKYIGNGCDISEETESSSDETIEENVVLVENPVDPVAANSVTDSCDESSQDCDLDITEHLYDDLEIQDNKDALHVQLNIGKEKSFVYELSSSTLEQQKSVSGGTIKKNYVYQSVPTSRRRTSLVARITTTNNGMLVKSE